MKTKEDLQKWCDSYNALPSHVRDVTCMSCEHFRPVFNSCDLHGEYNPELCGQYLHIVGQTRKVTRKDRIDLHALHLEYLAEQCEIEQQNKNKQLELF